MCFFPHQNTTLWKLQDLLGRHQRDVEDRLASECPRCEEPAKNRRHYNIEIYSTQSLIG